MTHAEGQPEGTRAGGRGGDGGAAGSGELIWSDEPPRRDEGRVVAVCRTDIPGDYAYFEGHFRGYPVLAGVVQLHELVLPSLARVHPGLGPLQAIRSVKFPARIQPGEAVELTLRWREGSADVAFDIRRDGERCTTGQLSFAPADGADGHG